ncbi:hypothetical protein G4O51_11135 [Candidatus Bathyarchaeota archaeon A05DMB-2]|jgi:hypothetical protein|nr:hypothetical protein [Candidatus Bathyarchaeota archaeon A05DMB-2]
MDNDERLIPFSQLSSSGFRIVSLRAAMHHFLLFYAGQAFVFFVLGRV